MAYDHADVPAAELALMAADKPYLVGRNWLRESATDARWNAAGAIGIADESDADGPASRGYDEHDHLQTYGDDAVHVFWYYVVDFGSEIAEIDFVAILNHNFATVASSGSPDGVRVQVQVANNDFTAGAGLDLDTIAEDTPSSDGRIIFPTLQSGLTGTAQRFTSVRYIRLRFDTVSDPGNDSMDPPKFGELIVGRRRQLAHKSTDWDPNHLTSSKRAFESDSGIRTEYVSYKGRKLISANLTPWVAARIADVETFWETETDFGTLPFIWIDDPTTSPGEAYWMRFTDPDLVGPIRGPTERLFRVNAIEQGPNFFKLES